MPRNNKRTTEEHAGAQQLEQNILERCPLACAILNNDMSSIQNIIQGSLPNNGAVIEDLTLEKTVGEAFTGGRSTPVYAICVKIKRKGLSRTRRFIVKLVQMDGSGEKISQLRESYAVEHRFYTLIADQIRPHLSIPKLVYSDLNGSKAWPLFCIMMNDVAKDINMLFSDHPLFLTVNQAKAALRWIATFHALFWGSQRAQMEWRLWDRGGFWTKTSDTSKISANWVQTLKFLETKHPGKLNQGKNLRLFGKRLQTAGTDIRLHLNKISSSSKLGTLIHGDYKAANMFMTTRIHELNEDSAVNVAVVDFQYTGAGVCTDDVAYLLYPDARGHFSDNDQEELLQCYYTELIEQLMLHGKGGPSTLSEESFRRLYRLSQLDMTRHWMQKGWATSTEAEVNLMIELDVFMAENFDGGEPLQDYGERLDQSAPIL